MTLTAWPWAGQLAGAIYGPSGILQEGIGNVAWSGHIQSLAQQFYEHAPLRYDVEDTVYGASRQSDWTPNEQ